MEQTAAPGVQRDQIETRSDCISVGDHKLLSLLHVSLEATAAAMAHVAGVAVVTPILAHNLTSCLLLPLPLAFGLGIRPVLILQRLCGQLHAGLHGLVDGRHQHTTPLTAHCAPDDAGVVLIELLLLNMRERVQGALRHACVPAAAVAATRLDADVVRRIAIALVVVEARDVDPFEATPALAGSLER
eukprot:7158596-Prymnesium_polylepis.1